MTFLSGLLISLGSILVGMAIAVRALAHHHARLDARRLQLDLDVLNFRKEQARAGVVNVTREHFERVVRSVLEENRPNRIGPSPGPSARKGWLQ